MPTYDLLTDDASAFPIQVRSPDGSAPRNATTEAAGLQDLANRTAWLRANGPDRIGNIAAMLGTTAVNGDVFFTRENGWYVFSGSITSGPDPFVKTSLVSTGSWVSVLWSILCGSSNPAKILAALIPAPTYPILIGVARNFCAVFSAGTQHITSSSTYTQINDGTADLSFSAVVQAGDKMRVSIGPIGANTSVGADSLTLNARVVDGSVTADYPVTFIRPSTSGLALTGFFEFHHDVPIGTTGVVSVQLQAKVNVGGSAYVYCDQAYGPSGAQWSRYEVIR